MRGLLKVVLIVVTLWIGGTLFAVMKAIGSGVLLQMIVAIGMFAGIKAIWSYKPASDEIVLKKDE